MKASRILRYQRERAIRWWRRCPDWVQEDAAVQAEAATWTQDAPAMVERLVGYFWAGHQHYRDSYGSLAYYPGWPSIYGARNDAIEGVTRLMPLWAAYAASPGADAARATCMLQALEQTLRHATDPAHPGYWGDIVHRSTLICEAADVALALWLGRNVLWPRLALDLRAQVVRWLQQAVGKRTADNNWHLFVVTVDAVLARLAPGHLFSSEDRLERVQSFAVSDGCFTDGPGGPVDFYNAWGFHYSMHWLEEMGVCEPSHALAKFCAWYQCLFTPKGLPLFGRSLCYRHAACTPLLLCASRAPEVVPSGVAQAALLANWRCFSARGGLRSGRPTQGVFGDDIRWLDPYSGPASSLWGTRSLVAHLALDPIMKWRQCPPQRVPVSGCKGSLRVPALQGHVVIDSLNEHSALQFETAGQSGNGGVRMPTAKDRWRQWLQGVASRPANNLRSLGRRRFSSQLNEYL